MHAQHQGIAEPGAIIMVIGYMIGKQLPLRTCQQMADRPVHAACRHECMTHADFPVPAGCRMTHWRMLYLHFNAVPVNLIRKAWCRTLCR